MHSQVSDLEGAEKAALRTALVARAVAACEARATVGAGAIAAGATCPAGDAGLWNDLSFCSMSLLRLRPCLDANARSTASTRGARTLDMCPRTSDRPAARSL